MSLSLSCRPPKELTMASVGDIGMFPVLTGPAAPPPLGPGASPIAAALCACAVAGSMPKTSVSYGTRPRECATSIMSAGSARANRSSAVRHPPPSVRSRSMRSRRVGLWPGGLGLRLEVEVEVSASARTEAGARGRESGTAIDARSAVAASRRGAGASVTLRCAGYSERFAVGSRKAALHACHTAGGPPLRGELGPAPPPPKSLCPLRELRGLIPLLPPRGVVGRGVMPVCCRTPTTASSYLYSCARREPILGCPSRPRMSLRKPQATRAGLPPGNITRRSS
mmetsp:Transcript_13966/g.33787  ORF Transcript_13966/g.33787 Transcript_13966/m.33787 type:complete len:282 (-) Transcript_13966:27-872(-)